MSRGGDGVYDRLQVTIYTRWVNQKLSARMFPTMEADVCASLGTDDHLSNLVTALSEKKMPKPAKPPMRKIKAQKLDWISKQLKFVWDCGVEMKLKPSPENIYDGDFPDIMGIVYAMMLKFLKFDDDDGESAGNAKEALLRWCQFHTKGFVNVNVTNLTKSWTDGLALCALVEKFAPSSVDFASLQPANATVNLQTALSAAEKLFKIISLSNRKTF
jgi:spectrin beta